VARALHAPPDLIVCDVSMPRLDGYAVLAELRRDPGTAVVPVVLLTGLGDALSHRRGMEEGADDFLNKPVRGSALIRAVRARLARHTATVVESRRRLEELRSSLARSLPHQFLTPLTAVMGLSSMLRDEVLQMDSTLVREVADGIYRGGESLQASIAKFLLLAELEIASRDADQVATMRGRRADERTIGRAARMTARRLGRQGDLTTALEPGSIAIGSDHLTALVDEVVENAALFSRPGTPLAVRCRRAGGEVSIEVDDHGEGMLPQAESFATFSYLSRRHAKEPGINPGLAIVREVARLYGGRVSFETRLGEGTTVRVTLPYEATPRPG